MRRFKRGGAISVKRRMVYLSLYIKGTEGAIRNVTPQRISLIHVV